MQVILSLIWSKNVKNRVSVAMTFEVMIFLCLLYDHCRFKLMMWCCKNVQCLDLNVLKCLNSTVYNFKLSDQSRSAMHSNVLEFVMRRLIG